MTRVGSNYCDGLAPMGFIYWYSGSDSGDGGGGGGGGGHGGGGSNSRSNFIPNRIQTMKGSIQGQQYNN